MSVLESYVRPVPAADRNPLPTYSPLLRQHPLFAALDDADFRAVCASARCIECEPRQMLFRHGEPASRFFMVLHGTIKLYRLTLHGSEKVIDAIGPGQSVGDCVMFAGERCYPCYAQCLEPTELLAVSNRHYRNLITGRADYNQALLTWFADSLCGRMQDMEVLTTQNATNRVIGYLRQLIPDPNAESAEVELPLPKALLASRLAMQPETLSRVLSSLQRCGILQVMRRRLIINDVGAMLRCRE
jgi:CRP/FNR family transcriptional regulator, dissimilatory nitrate respiration regulator